MYRCLILFLLVTLTSCQKIVEYYNADGKKKLPPCRIISLTNENGKHSYSYDPQGNLTGIERPPSEELGTTGYSAAFEYDDQQRLVTYSLDDYFQEKWNYVYEGNSRRPVRDTLINFILRQYVEDFTYDAAGRIIRIEKRFVGEDDGDWDIWGDPRELNDTISYFYDVRGNRQTLGAITSYSDKVEPTSLHPVLQLVDRYYSKNLLESSAAKSYNEFGLPLEYDNYSFEYDCE